MNFVIHDASLGRVVFCLFLYLYVISVFLSNVYHVWLFMSAIMMMIMMTINVPKTFHRSVEKLA